MNHRSILTALLWLFVSSELSAQRRGLPEADRLQLQGRHSLSISSLSAMNGMLPITYAQPLGGRLALQVLAGPTFRNLFSDVQQSFYKDGKRSNSFPETSAVFEQTIDFADDYVIGSNRKAALGFLAGAGLNCYLSDYTLNGKYLGILAQFRRYNTRAKRLIDNTPAYAAWGIYREDDPVREHGNLFDLALTYGSTRLYASGLVMEFTAQMGLSYQRYHMQDFGARNVLDTASGYVYSYLVNGAQNYSALRPYFNVDVRLGGWW